MLRTRNYDSMSKLFERIFDPLKKINNIYFPSWEVNSIYRRHDLIDHLLDNKIPEDKQQANNCASLNKSIESNYVPINCFTRN